jgi:hypothetical protein
MFGLYRVKDYERLVVFRLGRFLTVHGPTGYGCYITIPLVDRAVKVNLNDYIPRWQDLAEDELQEKVRQLPSIMSEYKETTDTHRVKHVPKRRMSGYLICALLFGLPGTALLSLGLLPLQFEPPGPALHTTAIVSDMEVKVRRSQTTSTEKYLLYLDFSHSDGKNGLTS